MNKSKGRRKPLFKYKLEMIFGMIGGTILFIIGAIGSADFYLHLIDLAKSYFGENTSLDYLALLFKTLASLGGITVIIGAFFIGIARRRIGGWFIGIGAGISLSLLLVKIIVLGPTLQNYIQSGYYIDALNLFGYEFGLYGLGVFLSFLAMLTNYRWMLYMFILAVLAMFIGATGDPSLLEKFILNLGLPSDYVVYINYLEVLLFYIGLVFLITTLIVGANHFKIAKLIVILGLIGLLPSLTSITMTFIFGGSTLLFLTRLIVTYLLLIGEIFFIVKAKPVIKA